MPIELYASIMILGLQLGFGRKQWRLAAYVLALPAAWLISPFFGAFIAGLILANLTAAKDGSVRVSRNRIATLFFLGILAVAPLVPRQLVSPNVIVAILLFMATLSSESAKRFLSSRLSSFLGRISFSIYILHGIVIFSLGEFLHRFAHSSAAILMVNAVIVLACVLFALCFQWVDSVGIQTARWVSTLIFSRAMIQRNSGRPDITYRAKPASDE